MDYQGQKLSERLYYYIIIIMGAIGWVIGYIQQDFMQTFYVWFVGTAVSVVLCVPDWPIYNRHPVDWLKEVPSSENSDEKDASKTDDGNSGESKKSTKTSGQTKSKDAKKPKSKKAK